jgi:hypothetical protein
VFVDPVGTFTRRRARARSSRDQAPSSG